MNPSHRLLPCSPRSRLARGEGCCNRGGRCWHLPLDFSSPTPGVVRAPGFPPERRLAPGPVTLPPAGDLRPQQSRPRSGSGPRRLKASGWGGSPGHRHPSSHTHRRRGDRCPGPPGPAAHERPPPRAPPVGPTRARTRQQTPRPAPKESLTRATRKPERTKALPEGGPYAGGVCAFDLLQDPLVLRDRAQSLAALRHLGWKRRRRPGAASRGHRSERQVAQARRDSEGRGLGAGAEPCRVGRRGWGLPLERYL